MQLVKPGFEELIQDNLLEHIERCARVCYKSENLIKENSASEMVKRLSKAEHTAMLEHGTVYLKILKDHLVHSDECKSITESPYSKTYFYKEFAYITTNLRVIIENHKDLYDEIFSNNGNCGMYSGNNIELCKYEDSPYFEKRVTIKFILDRIGSQSFCRHRLFSFAQESTRWCNYMKAKFGSEISISTPCWLKVEDEEEFKKDMELYEKIYFKWLDKGYLAEEARYFLPFGLKTEIIMTGIVKTWKHFFTLRVDSHAHKQARELAIPLQDYFMEKEYILCPVS